MKKEKMLNKPNLIFFMIIVLAAVARIIPHPPNFTPIGGLALFSGAHFKNNKAYLIPLGAMLLSDLFLGFHSTMIYVYFSFFMIILLGKLLRDRLNIIRLGVISLTASVIFFMITNFGVWFTFDFYSKDVRGLTNCFLMAVPFFRNTILGDLFYSFSFFYGYQFLDLIIKKLSFSFKKN
ncbi:hypothetical protein COS31_03175 [Candidatus Roizmanbacteria bacterium CG02_land_8_20_14_3_00_36_15]|uniref:Rod shape-determining protein MreD n=2 Tax=Candidatus Roizmaniibacteriota TaxID=1752723 RepID=A0A2M8KLI5_9BACT|nr:MAG: hypothetical protein COS51_03615 [Candidatus Roizmanbacteria bacterium CG03_land_8_20_14_0_80_36_21]PIV37680.1 MAG: hypothetical protein COS31_03175 [Candidatus Roizmanbacteria bacterium CG02_land_8_20_14_3_00_36_15]PIY69637.1 MAG: hypothetical protein COY89_05180 [Candidatus Roizmanbacteria bacterium CG_4_10_14_0_8_um_filter_36_36]PJA53509.1 MAG: hypothetical protein CO166_01385 [Candidatus Roizmanbacteria bacterium CG_4_9_14_3_um_filter_36_11]PJC82147.1 MAG: hypothetical protein CO007